MARSGSDDGRVEFTGCLHGAEGDVEDAATAGPGIPRLAEAREQPGGHNRTLGRIHLLVPAHDRDDIRGGAEARRHVHGAYDNPRYFGT